MDISSGVTQRAKELQVDIARPSSILWGPSGRVLYFVATSRGVQNIWKVGVDQRTLSLVDGPERLTTGPGADSDIAITGDGKRLAFTTQVTNDRIWSLPFEVSSGRVLGDGQAVTESGKLSYNVDLTRDGKMLVFLAEHDEKQELWKKSVEDSSETLLKPWDGSRRYTPCWSREGKRLAYRRGRYLNSERTQLERPIVLMEAAGGEERLLTSPDPGVNDIACDWSADGEWILGSSNRGSKQYRLCLFPVSAAPHAESGMRVSAEHPDFSLWQGRFSPDERWIIFNATTMDDPISVIYVISASGGPWTPLTDQNYWADKGRWSADGRTIYFLSNRLTGLFNVWGRRFDPLKGKPVGEPFQVTSFESPGRMILPLVANMEMALSARRLILPIREISGNIWVLENVAR
jgi:Tol biopolymer transport system component